MANDNKQISFVIPCYRSAETLPAVVEGIREMMTPRGGDYEVILVNDGSPDRTWEVITALCADPGQHCRGIDLARNFGQHAALMAGLRAAKGEVLVCMDDDGQTPAKEAPKLLQALDEGADVAYARYEKAHRSAFRGFGTACNDAMLRLMLGKPKELTVTSFFAMRRFVAEEICRYENAYPYLVGLVLRATSHIVNVDVEHRERLAGNSGYTPSRLFRLWMNGFTAFSVTPLRIATWLGTCFALLGFAYGIYTILKKLINPAVPMGFSALMSAVVFIGGMLMLLLGMVGEYVGRTYLSVNRAPQYVVRQTTEDR